MDKILATVILYFPDRHLLEAIDSYKQHVDHLLLIDNSEPACPWLADELKKKGWSSKATMHVNPSNLGIAAPLNFAARFAEQRGFQWLLTMDQDSRFEGESMAELKSVALNSERDVAIISPYHLTPKASRRDWPERVKLIPFAMTSGNLLRIEAWKSAGDFDEKLFIDSVDHEYCLRLRRKGHRIQMATRSILLHPLGEIEYHRLLFFRVKTTGHSPVRRYYITRNRLNVMFRYAFFSPKFFFREFRELIKSFFVVLLVDDKKGTKLRWMYRGVWHFVVGRYGKA